MRSYITCKQLTILTLAILVLVSLVALPALDPGRLRSSVQLPETLHANLPAPATSGRVPADEQTKARLSEAYGKLPLSFEANAGQTDARVKFISRGAGYTLFLMPDEAVLALSRSQQHERQEAAVQGIRENPLSTATDVLKMKVIGANREAVVAGLEELQGKVNYFAGKDSAKWRIDISTYEKVHYEEVYAGIDLVYYGNNRQLEYDFKVAAGADPGRIKLGFEGAKRISIDAGGDLLLETEGGEVRQHKPVIYQERAGARQEISGGYVMLSNGEVGFEIGEYDRSRKLVIDPTIVYATYFPGNISGWFLAAPFDIAVDSQGNAYVTGWTFSTDFPTTPGAFQTTYAGPGTEAFVTKINATGTALVYSTYLGGNQSPNGIPVRDYGTSITVDASGNAYIKGTAASLDFPTTPGAFQTSRAPGSDCPEFVAHSCNDAFVTKLNPAGNALVFSTYLGGNNADSVFDLVSIESGGIALDSAGNVCVTGSTYSTDFPTTPGAFQTNLRGIANFYVTKLNATGTALIFSTYLGDSGDFQELFGEFTGQVQDLAVDANGFIYLTGYTLARDFPTTPGAFDRSPCNIGGSCSNGFVTKFAPTGGVVYSTRFPGYCSGIAADSSGSAYITGFAYSYTVVPTTPGAFQESVRSNGGGYISKLNPSGSGFVYSTYLAGSNDYDRPADIAIDAEGNAYVTGTAASTDFPLTPGAIQTSPGAFITKLNQNGTALRYSTFFGASSGAAPTALALDSAGNAYIVGSASAGYPTTPGAYRTTLPPDTNSGFITKLDSCSYYLIPFAQTFPSTGGMSSFDVDVLSESSSAPCNGIWVADTSSNWITVTSGTGTGDGTVNYTVAPNPDAMPRTGKIEVKNRIYTIEQEACPTTIDPANRTLAHTAGSSSVAINGQGCDWSAFTVDSWITITSPLSGSGNAILNFNVTANPNSEPRTGRIIIGDNIFEVIQEGCPSSITPTSHSFTAQSSYIDVNLTSQGCNWITTRSAGWITASPPAGSGNATITISVPANTGPPRTGTVTIAGQTFAVQQAGCPVSITPAAQAFNAAGGTGAIGVLAAQGCIWNASPSDTWITIQAGNNGTGNGTVNFTVAANSDAAPRTGIIIVDNNTFTITQAACEASINPSSKSFTTMGGLGTINITTTCKWNAATSASWINFAYDGSISGTGNGSVTFSVGRNFEAPRTGTITVAGKTFTVTQDGCQTSISPASNTILAAGGTGSVSVTAQQGCSWNAANSVSWIHITAGRSGNGNGTVSYSVQKNTQGQPRTGTLTIAGKTFTLIQEAAMLPVITSVTRQYPGVFLKGTTLTNEFLATIDWKGQNPGTVKFAVTGGATAVKPAMGNTASHSFNLASDFMPMFLPSIVILTPTTAEGIVGQPRTEQLYLFDFPKWLQDGINEGYGELGFTAGGGEIKYCVEREFPKPHLAENGPIDIPESVPYIGGQFGLTETFARIKGCVSSNGTGTLTLFGQTGFKAAGGELKGNATGSGIFALGPPSGFNVRSASFALNLNGTLTKEVGLADAIPQLAALQNTPVLGKPIKWLNEKAQLEGEISPSLGFTAAFQQNLANGNLDFKDGTGTLGLDLKATLKVPIADDRLKASAWVGGGGSFLLGVPVTTENPFVRQMNIQFQAGAEFKLDYLISYKAKAVYNSKCTWTPQAGVVCESAGSVEGSQSTGLGAVTVIQPDYNRFGPYALFKPVARPKQNTSLIPASVAETVIAANVFAGAAPHQTEVLAGTEAVGKLLLWVHQDTKLPVLQSTDINWSYYNGTSWSTAAPIAHDTRVELSPVAGVDASGRIVAAWLRIKDAAFSSPINTASNLPQFYTQLEVVSAVFNPTTQSWGPVTQLTNDAALDTSLRLSSDSAGNLMLTWVSNAAGEFRSSPAAPSTLKYATWNATSWSAPAVVASNLAGISTHEADRNGSNAFIILGHDPDPDVTDDGVLELYTWDGVSWSAASIFASAGEQRLPSATYDSLGEGHIAWSSGTVLVHATLSNPSPQIVRAGSSGMSFYEVKLMTNAVGNLTLVWTEGVDNGPANIFARIYDPASGVWSADRRLSQDSTLAQNVNGFFGADGKIYLAYLATTINRISQSVSFPGGTTVIPNIPQDGQTDLRLLDHSLITDLSVVDKDLSILPVDPVAGTEVNATLNIHNGGDFAVNAFTVKLYVGDPATGGIEVGSQTVSGPFAAGDASALNFTFIYPATTANIIVVVDTANEVTEFLETNNRATYHLTNSPPVARIVAPLTTGIGPLMVSLDATTSSDPNGDTLVYSWAFGDNTASVAGATVSHTFTQRGAYPVTLTAIDSKGAIGTAVVWINVGQAFSDVPANHLFYTEITKLSARGVTLGCGGDSYCPEVIVTREQMAAFIVRALGQPNPAAPASQRFADVPPTHPFYGFIDQMAVRQITLGCSSSTYCPGSLVTREQMAAFMIRALGEFFPAAPASQRFADVPPTHPFYGFIDQMAIRQITLGCGNMNYCPSSPVTRAQMAAFLVRAFNL
jgi:hypothetical protein